jgi:hypothetical protein
VHCYCKKCNGILKDLRTKISHKLKCGLSYANNNFSNEAGSSNVMPFDAIDDNVMECDLLFGINDKEDIESLLANYSFLTKKIPIYESAKHQMIKKGKVNLLIYLFMNRQNIK